MKHEIKIQDLILNINSLITEIYKKGIIQRKLTASLIVAKFLKRLPTDLVANRNAVLQLLLYALDGKNNSVYFIEHNSLLASLPAAADLFIRTLGFT